MVRKEGRKEVGRLTKHVSTLSTQKWPKKERSNNGRQKRQAYANMRQRGQQKKKFSPRSGSLGRIRSRIEIESQLCSTAVYRSTTKTQSPRATILGFKMGDEKSFPIICEFPFFFSFLWGILYLWGMFPFLPSYIRYGNNNRRD